ncbi:Detected protein of confused Function [Hibiscus syriacus]|uniref:Detected protein of confused Function n=1 Tax=Hibiscus syriacus TaxID=106335 RepID=A0A6A3CA55_HIBSY|nr:Detected protein of confused Function [Hibiscus syriacus]
MAGIGDKCTNGGISEFTEVLSKWSNSQGYCVEIGDGSWDSWTMPLSEQTSTVCEKVVKPFGEKMSELSKGCSIVGLSQGNLIGQGVIEFCDGGLSVKNFISMGGPHAGTASIPFCGVPTNLTKCQLSPDGSFAPRAPHVIINQTILVPKDQSLEIDLEGQYNPPKYRVFRQGLSIAPTTKRIRRGNDRVSNMFLQKTYMKDMMQPRCLRASVVWR